MVFLNVYYPKRFEKGSDPEKTLLKKIQAVKALAPYRNSLQKAVLGKYKSSSEMRFDIANVIQPSKKRRRSKKEGNQAPFFMETGGIAVLALIYYLFSLLL
ncbi:hypothetical protein [Virgibacillus ainsalahensis]